MPHIIGQMPFFMSAYLASNTTKLIILKNCWSDLYMLIFLSEFVANKLLVQCPLHHYMDTRITILNWDPYFLMYYFK